jgi:eight-cysteine-cluster-containing protein
MSIKTPARVVVTVLAVSAALLSLSCGCKQPSPAGPGASPGPSATPEPTPGPGPDEPPASTRSPFFTPGAVNYDRFEGTSFQNACSSDSDCLESGCSGEVCAAENVNSTCDVQLDKPTGGCGCVEGLCIWYKGGAVQTGGAASGCGGDSDCQDGKSCVKYYGIAGPSGPQFSSCEHPCSGGKACPAGLSCTTIADGPGQVCR